MNFYALIGRDALAIRIFAHIARAALVIVRVNKFISLTAMEQDKQKTR